MASVFTQLFTEAWGETTEGKVNSPRNNFWFWVAQETYRTSCVEWVNISAAYSVYHVIHFASGNEEHIVLLKLLW